MLCSRWAHIGGNDSARGQTTAVMPVPPAWGAAWCIPGQRFPVESRSQCTAAQQTKHHDHANKQTRAHSIQTRAQLSLRLKAPTRTKRGGAVEPASGRTLVSQQSTGFACGRGGEQAWRSLSNVTAIASIARGEPLTARPQGAARLSNSAFSSRALWCQMTTSRRSPGAGSADLVVSAADACAEGGCGSATSVPAGGERPVGLGVLSPARGAC